MSKIKEIKKCLCCDNDKIKTVLDFGKQPLANSYHEKDEILDVFPLKLNLCEKCWHLQLSHAVNPNLMFKNYLYVSGTSNTLREYFDSFAVYVLKNNPNSKNVLDIACNDGSQLDSFAKIGLKTYGVDPAENLYELSKSKGHDIVCDYFTKKSIKKLGGNKFDLITAQNVFAHNTYPLYFLKLCKKILKKNGSLYIQTSQANMVVNNEFDTIYHEHISFFNTISMKHLVEKSGLFLNDVIKSDIHGTSYVFVIGKNENVTKNVQESIDDIIKNNLTDTLTYIKYSLNAYDTTINLKNTIKKYKDKGYHIIGYGAAAKGNTLLNFGGISVDYILDDNELKLNLYTPGMNILIKEPEFIKSLPDNVPIVFIPFAWNFYKEIKSKIKVIRDKDEDIFIKYFPTIVIEK